MSRSFRARRAVTAGLAVTIFLAIPALCFGAPAAERQVVHGLPVYAQHAATERVVVRAYIRAGESAGEAAEAGIARLTAAWLEVGGNESFPGSEFVAARQALGCEISVRADRELLVVEAFIDPERFRPSLRLFADLLLYPAFDAKARTKARLKAKAMSIAVGGDAALARRSIEPAVERDRSDEAPRFDHRRGEVLAFYRRHVGVDTTVLAISGPLADVDLTRELESAFIGFRGAGQATPIQIRATKQGAQAMSGRGANLALRARQANRSRFLCAWLGVPRADADWLAVELGIVASCLVQSDWIARATNLTATRLWLEQPVSGLDLTVLELSVPDRGLHEFAEARRGALAEIKRGRADAAVERARTLLESSLVPPADAAGSAVAHAILEALGLPGQQPSERHASLLRIAPRDVAEAANRHLR